MTIPNNIYQDVLPTSRTREHVNQDTLCFNSTNPGFWVGKATGVQLNIPLMGVPGPELPIEAFNKADLSNNIIGPKSAHIEPTLIDLSKITIMQPPKTAIRYDDGKINWSLVPFEALEGMAEVLTFGAKKYASWNWTEGGGFSYIRVINSCLRHLFAFMRGEDKDPESGLSHISHAQCNLLFLAYYIRDKKKFNKDDRNVR